MTRYITHNLDEAAYLVLSGYPFKVRRTSPTSSVFTFETDKLFNSVVRSFWRGEATVQLHRWLATRWELKQELAGQSHDQPRTPRRPLLIRTGTPYYYNDEKGDVAHALYGHSDTHMSRLKSGNFYQTSEDARLRRNPMRAA